MPTSKKAPSKFNFEVAFLSLLLTSQLCDAAHKTSQLSMPTNVTAVTGVGVELKCKVRLQDCGNFYSIEWYRDTTIGVAHDNNVNFNDDDNDDDDHGQHPGGSRGKRVADFKGSPGTQRNRRQVSLASPETYDPVMSVESERVYVYRHHSGIAKSEGSWEGRAQHQYDTKRHVMTIRLSPLMLDDEANYRCEITYEETGRWFKHSCPSPQITRLAVLGRPTFVSVTMENGTRVDPNGVVGPYTEGSLLVLRCKSGGGRPIPEVSWWRGSSEVSNAWHWRVEHDNGTGSTQSEINVIMTRDYIGQTLDCRVNSSALDSPIVHSVHVDMEVSPNSLVMISKYNSTENTVYEGKNVTVTCIASGAKPPAYIYWNSDPELLQEDTHEDVTREANGLTFKTTNRLTFQARRQLTSLSCFASNKVLDEKKAIHLKRDVTINVKYKPVVEKPVRIETINAVHGEPVSLVCRFTANPTAGAQVSWFRNGILLERDLHDEKRNEKADGSVIRIDAEKNLEGLYSCSAENELGRSSLVDIASLSVEEKPRVRIVVEPELPLSEAANGNVTLKCRLEDQSHGKHSAQFVSVQWFLDGELLKHVEKHPDCLMGGNHSHMHHCHVDPSKIILVNVRRSFRGNYSCRGQNRAGWGQVSLPTELHVLYPPSKTKISYEPPIVKKGQYFQIKCHVEDLGYPFATRVRWLHNGREIIGLHSYSLSVKEADASAGGNYTCTPYNEEGESQSATVSIRIFAPPTFVQHLPMFTGTPYNRQIARLKCLVECDPLCSIMWFRNSDMISAGMGSNRSLSENTVADRHYVIRTSVKSPDVTANLLHHVESILELDFDRWPGGQLVPSRDMANYSCRTTETSVGPSVESTTMFRVHYPPRNITVTPTVLTVHEKTRIEPFHCHADAFPEAKYYWHFETGNRSSTGTELEFRHALRRDQTGIYTCNAYNDLGNAKASVQLNVIYKPMCRLRKLDSPPNADGGSSNDESDDGLHLRCDVDAFPNNVTFIWYHNDEPLPTEVGANLHFRHAHQHHGNVVGNFSCEAKNIAGVSERCGIRVNGPVAALVAETDLTLLMFGGGVVVVVFVVILGAILICRRSGTGNGQLLKYNLHPLPSCGKTNGMTNNGVHSAESHKFGNLNDDDDESESLKMQSTVAVTSFDQQAATESKIESGNQNDGISAAGQIINGHQSGRVGTLERPRVTIAEPAMNTFRSGFAPVIENGRRFEQSSEPVNEQFSTTSGVVSRQMTQRQFDLNMGSFEMREGHHQAPCSIPGSHERPPPPRYRRSDYIVTERDFDEGRRIMTLDRRRAAAGSGYDNGIRTGDATMSRQVKYCSVLNQSNGSMVVDGQMFPGRRFVAQNGGRRDELWLV